MSKLLKRIATAIVLVVILLVVFFRLPEFAAIGLLGLFVVAAAWEWAGFLEEPSTLVRVAFAALIAALLAALSLGSPDPRLLFWVLGLGMLWWVCAMVMVARYPVHVPNALRLPCGLLVLLPAWVALLMVLRHPAGGPDLLLLGLALIWAADIGAYVAGRRLGRNRLAPQVSPGKTWEGVAGGLVAAGLVAFAGARLLGLPPLTAVGIALPVVLLSIVGDLTISVFKRMVGLKDSGSLFPGHGGVLDRVDSLAAAMPLFALLALQLGLLEA